MGYILKNFRYLCIYIKVMLKKLNNLKGKIIIAIILIIVMN